MVIVQSRQIGNKQNPKEERVEQTGLKTYEKIRST